MLIVGVNNRSQSTTSHHLVYPLDLFLVASTNNEIKKI